MDFSIFIHLSVLSLWPFFGNQPHSSLRHCELLCHCGWRHWTSHGRLLLAQVEGNPFQDCGPESVVLIASSWIWGQSTGAHKYLLSDPQGAERTINTMGQLSNGLFRLSQAITSIITSQAKGLYRQSIWKVFHLTEKCFLWLLPITLYRIRISIP